MAVLEQKIVSAAHLAREYISSMHVHGIFVKMDFSNAFNNVRHDIIIQRVSEQCTEIRNFVKVSYDSVSSLVCGDYLVHEAEIFQQSDLLATFGFFLVIHQLLKKLAAAPENGLLG